ncbi:MAG: S-layer homology domain-containing protein [Candidatus Gracilibacteria bacterium]
MKKTISSLLTTTLLITLSSVPAHAQSFSDLPSNSSYSTAINYLADANIINGYPDGTFKPNQQVNRAEFLKLVLESSEIPKDVTTPTPFPDIDNTAWYAQYVRKAYSEGWIQGYPDGTFKPEQSINKVEALKIIGEIQQWQLEQPEEKPYTDIEISAWFSSYVSYAKEKNFLEERTSLYFPELLFTRAQVSEVLFRSFITTKSGEDVYSPLLATKYPAADFAINPSQEPAPTPAPTQPQPTNFTPVEFKTYNTDFFEDVRLDETISNTFYLNEVYYIEGTITADADFEEIFTFLAPEGTTSSSQYLNFIADVNNKKFSIPVIFRQAGNYKMGIIPGTAGESKVINISVLNDLPEAASGNASPPTQPTLQYKNQNTTVDWKSPGSDITQLTIYQDNISKDFFFRQNKNSFNIDYVDFLGFQNGTTRYKLRRATISSQAPLTFSSAWSSTTTPLTFQATEHNFSLINEDVNITNLPELLSNTSQISFSATSSTEVFLEAAITKPDGFVELFDMSSSGSMGDFYDSPTVLPGSTFTYSYTPTEPGTYIVEVNGTDGTAVINTPVYVANGTPLIPDFFDLNAYVETEQNFSLQNSREQLLKLINEERSRHGLSSVIADPDLNQLAQEHSNDMKNRDYFNHIDPDGNTPNDRRLAHSIPMPVGENLALAPTTLYTHEGLMRSGIHRNNILNPDWAKVGIGIAVNNNGSLLTTQEFSRNPYTDSELNAIENKIISAINSKRSQVGVPIMQIGSDIQFIADEWSKKMAELNFNDFTSPNGDTLEDLVGQYAPNKAVQAIVLDSVNLQKIIEKAVAANETTKSSWIKIGVGVKSDNIGSLKTTVLYTTN